MATNKRQKKKERERRVAKKKIADAAHRRAQKTAKELQEKGVPQRTKVMTGAVPKTDYVPANKKTPFTRRRSGD